jgi:hypothetical protein
MVEAAGSVVGSAPGSSTLIFLFFYRFLEAGILHHVSFPINNDRGGQGAACYFADSEIVCMPMNDFHLMS